MISILSVLFIQYGLRFISWFRESCNLENIKATGFRLASTYIPQVKAHIDKELENLRVDSVKKYVERRKDALRSLPAKGQKSQDILAKINKIAAPSWKYF